MKVHRTGRIVWERHRSLEWTLLGGGGEKRAGIYCGQERYAVPYKWGKCKKVRVWGPGSPLNIGFDFFALFSLAMKQLPNYRRTHFLNQMELRSPWIFKDLLESCHEPALVPPSPCCLSGQLQCGKHQKGPHEKVGHCASMAEPHLACSVPSVLALSLGEKKKVFLNA